MRSALLALIAAVGLSLPAVPAQAVPAAMDDTSSTLSVVNALPDSPADVVNEAGKLFENVQPGDVAGPIDVPAGDYQISFIAPGATDATTTPIVGPSLVSVSEGEDVSVVAHLGEGDVPVLSTFSDDLSETQAPLAGRLVVRNAAATSPFDVMIGGRRVFTDVETGTGAAEDMEVGDYELAFVDAGTDEPTTVPVDVVLEPGMVTVVYLTGSRAADTLDYVTTSLEASRGTGTVESPVATASASPSPTASPSASPAADMGDDEGGISPLWWWIIGGVVVVALAAGIGSAAARRNRA